MSSDTIAQARIGALIRKSRQQSKMTLKELSDKAGISVGYLSQVERANATPSLGTLAQIADALQLGLEYFVARPKASDAVSRSERRPQFSISESGITYETLSTAFPGYELSSFILNCPADYKSELFQHEGEEIIYILEGEIEQSLGDERFTLRPGDSLHYNGATPHSWHVLGKKPARILWTGTLSVLQGKLKTADQF